jgi:hypothetical protein
MISPLDIHVSCFKNYKTSDNPRPVHLMKWLKSTKYADTVNQIREISDKKKRDRLKSTLPAITPSGQFSYRSKSNLIKHSGLIQFDIDWKDNQHIANYEALKTEICKIVNVAYVGLSVSGRGYWGLIPIKYPDKHKSHFRAMKKAFKNFGLQLDDKPSNVASLRGYSYDPNGYINHYAKVFESLDDRKQDSPRSFNFKTNSKNSVEQIIAAIQESRIDITDGYDNWLNIGFALADEFGEGGRSHFHAVSQFHPEYNARKTDQQFTHCLRSGGTGITIASFFHLCKQYGITLKEANSDALHKKDRALQCKFECRQTTSRSDGIQKLKKRAEYDEALKRDPILRQIDELFEPELIDE